MTSPNNSISDSLLHADWDSIADALTMLESGIKGNDPASRKLRTQAGLVRVIMCENIRTWNGNNSIDASFLIASYKTIRKMEKEFENKGVKNRQFLIFLRLLLLKFEKQKLMAKKPYLMIEEFGRMKEAVENESDSL